MNFKEILIFDISSEYGHFRKYNTTTSPLTYSIPTRTAIAGILGAILGMEREIRDGVYPEGVTPVQEFFSKENSGIGIQILNPVKKVTVGFNLINTKKSFYDLTKAGRTQIEFELLKEPKFRIFLYMSQGKEFEELIDRIINKRHHFTPYFGLSQFTANVEFIDKVGSSKIENSKKEIIKVITAVNLSETYENEPVKFDYSAFYSANNTPVEMNRYREVREYSEILIEKKGKQINAKVKEYYCLEKYGKITFL